MNTLPDRTQTHAAARAAKPSGHAPPKADGASEFSRLMSRRSDDKTVAYEPVEAPARNRADAASGPATSARSSHTQDHSRSRFPNWSDGRSALPHDQGEPPRQAEKRSQEPDVGDRLAQPTMVVAPPLRLEIRSGPGHELQPRAEAMNGQPKARQKSGAAPARSPQLETVTPRNAPERGLAARPVASGKATTGRAATEPGPRAEAATSAMRPPRHAVKDEKVASDEATIAGAAPDQPRRIEAKTPEPAVSIEAAPERKVVTALGATMPSPARVPPAAHDWPASHHEPSSPARREAIPQPQAPLPDRMQSSASGLRAADPAHAPSAPAWTVPSRAIVSDADAAASVDEDTRSSVPRAAPTHHHAGPAAPLPDHDGLPAQSRPPVVRAEARRAAEMPVDLSRRSDAIAQKREASVGATVARTAPARTEPLRPETEMPPRVDDVVLPEPRLSADREPAEYVDPVASVDPESDREVAQGSRVAVDDRSRAKPVEAGVATRNDRADLPTTERPIVSRPEAARSSDAPSRQPPPIVPGTSVRTPAEAPRTRAMANGHVANKQTTGQLASAGSESHQDAATMPTARSAPTVEPKHTQDRRDVSPIQRRRAVYAPPDAPQAAPVRVTTEGPRSDATPGQPSVIREPRQASSVVLENLPEPKPQSSAWTGHPVARPPPHGPSQDIPRAVAIETELPRSIAARHPLSSIPAAQPEPSTRASIGLAVDLTAPPSAATLSRPVPEVVAPAIAASYIRASKPEEKPEAAAPARAMPAAPPSADIALPEPVTPAAPDAARPAVKTPPPAASPETGAPEVRISGPGENQAKPVIALETPLALDVQPQPRRSETATVPKGAQPALAAPQSPEPAMPAMESGPPVAAQPDVEPKPQVGPATAHERQAPVTSPAPSAPSFATQVAIAAARYSLPASDRRFEQAAMDAPAAMPTSQPAQAGLSASARLVLRQGFLSAAVPPDRAAPTAQTADALIDAIPSSADAPAHGKPIPRARPEVAMAEQTASPAAASPAPAVAQSPAPLGAPTVAATPSPAASLAAAITAEPSWRPAHVVVATQFGGDRTPGPPATLSIQLNPGNLGIVTATLSMSGAQLKVGLTTQSAEAHERLKAESHTIEKAMHALGYEVGEIVVTQSLVAPGSIVKTEMPPSTIQPGGRDAQSSGSQDASGGNRSAGQNGERNGHGSSSASGALAPQIADRGGVGVYI